MFAESFEMARPYLEREYEETKLDASTGKSASELTEEVTKIENTSGGSVQRVKAESMAYVLKNGRLAVNEHGIFADMLELGSAIEDSFLNRRKKAREEVAALFPDTVDAMAVRCFYAEPDMGHTAPDWEAIMALGIPGLLERLTQYRQKNAPLTPAQQEFYETGETVYRGIIAWLRRLSDYTARAGTDKMRFIAENTAALARSAPQTLPQALQLIFTVYYVQHELECLNLRSLGRIDKYLSPLFEADIASGRYTEAEEREFLRYFLLKLYAKKVAANVPLTLCGVLPEGGEASSRFTRVFLEEYIGLDINDPKIHIRYSEQLPEDIFEMVLRSIRSGRNSMLFISDDSVRRSLETVGIEPKEAADYCVIGCYEPTASGKELPCTCAGRVNLAKAVEMALFGGEDVRTGKQVGPGEPREFADFEAFLDAYERQLGYYTDCAIRHIRGYEKRFFGIKPVPFFSGTMLECVQSGVDAYAGGVKYNNVSIVGVGVATAVDALAAIKTLVFDRKEATMDTLRRALRANWEGFGELRAKAMYTAPKYGAGDETADAIMARVCDFFCDRVNNQPGALDGVFRAGFFSIDWRYPYGSLTAASADGRLAGEPLSKNFSATIGMDTKGVTALIGSATKADYTKTPDGGVLDIVLHASAVKGEDGLAAMKGLVRTYMKRGGFAIQCNVLDPSVLRKAQAEPEKYRNLQIRLCGWNVYFVDLERSVQDEFIFQSEQAGA